MRYKRIYIEGVLIVKVAPNGIPFEDDLVHAIQRPYSGPSGEYGVQLFAVEEIDDSIEAVRAQLGFPTEESPSTAEQAAV